MFPIIQNMPGLSTIEKIQVVGRGVRQVNFLGEILNLG